MYSLNVPVPSEVSALATDLAGELPRARARRRGEHTLVVKRLPATDRTTYQRRAARVREELSGAPAFEVRVSGIEYFPEASSGPSPVVYLAVESPGIERLHRQLASVFDPVDGLEGEAYVPHVTIARGGTDRGARQLAGREIDPIEWTVSEVAFWDADRNQTAGSVSLPA